MLAAPAMQQQDWHHPRPRRRGSPRRRAAERPRDHGHGTRPSPTQTAPGGGRSRDHLVGGGRGASHVLYPDLAGRASWPGGHRGDGGERGGAQQPFLSIELSNGFSRAQSLPRRRSWLHRAASLLGWPRAAPALVRARCPPCCHGADGERARDGLSPSTALAPDSGR